MTDEHAPPHVCENCRRQWRAWPAAARDDLVVCLHRKLAVRRTSSGWTRLDGINAEEARLLRSPDADCERRFEKLDQAEQREREVRAAARTARRSTREERIAALLREADSIAAERAPQSAEGA